MYNSKSVIRLVNPNDSQIDLISNWFYNWWGKEESWSIEKIKTYVKNLCTDKILPACFVCLIDNEIKGVCMVSHTDADVRPDIYPWLINVYVDEPYRNQKIGSALIECAIKYVKDNGFKELYNYTTITGLYEKFGFEKIDNLLTYEDNVIYNLYKRQF